MSSVLESRKKVVEDFVAMIGTEEDLHWTKSWVTRKMPYNPVSEIRYRGGNILRLLIASDQNDYTDPRWMTFLQAKSKGYHIKKGEHGTTLEKLVFVEKIDKEDPEKKYQVPVIKFFVVFNGEQIDGIPQLPNNITREPADEVTEDLIRLFFDSSECPINYQGMHAYYSIRTDSITLPDKKRFFSSAGHLSTMLHEMGHSTGSPERLRRDMSGSFGLSSYAKEEVRAEMSAAILMSEMGMADYYDADGVSIHENSAAYLKNWLSEISDNPNELFKALADCNLIVERLKTNAMKKLLEGTYMPEVEERLNWQDNLVKQDCIEIQPTKTIKGKAI